MPARKIEDLTAADYKRALLTLHPLAEHHMAMLGAHYRAPQHTVTATEMSQVMDYANYNAVNLHYGKFAEQVCDFLGHNPNTKLSILVTFHKPHEDPEEHCRLVLRKQVVEALDELNWF